MTLTTNLTRNPLQDREVWFERNLSLKTIKLHNKICVCVTLYK